MRVMLVATSAIVNGLLFPIKLNRSNIGLNIFFLNLNKFIRIKLLQYKSTM